MENREITLPNSVIPKPEKELVFPTTEAIVGTVSYDNSREIMMSAKNLFVEQFQNASVEQKRVAVEQFYKAIDTLYKTTYRGRSVPIVFSESGGYTFNHDGFISIPVDELEKQTLDQAIFSLFHEYRHAMQPSLNVYSSGMGLEAFTKLGHDMRVEEIDATKFAFNEMDSLGFDKTKINRYDDWQKAIRITDNLDLLRLNYGQETTDGVLAVYKLLDEYTFQTTRTDFMSDDIKGTINKIQSRLKWKSNLSTARTKITELEKVAKLNGDNFLLKVISDIKTDWPQFRL